MSEVKVYHKNIGGIFQGEEKFIEVVAKADYDALQRDLATARAERDELIDNLERCKGNELAAQLATARAQVIELAEIIIAYYSTTPHCVDYQRAVALKREIDHA